MTLKFNKDHKLEFDLHDLLSGAADETKIQLIESLACDDAIIKHVTDQILDHWTENCYCGSRDYEVGSQPLWPLDIAARRIALRAGEVAKNEIERLEKSLAAKEKQITDLYEQIYELQSRRC